MKKVTLDEKEKFYKELDDCYKPFRESKKKYDDMIGILKKRDRNYDFCDWNTIDYLSGPDGCIPLGCNALKNIWNLNQQCFGGFCAANVSTDFCRGTWESWNDEELTFENHGAYNSICNNDYFWFLINQIITALFVSISGCLQFQIYSCATTGVLNCCGCTDCGISINEYREAVLEMIRSQFESYNLSIVDFLNYLNTLLPTPNATMGATMGPTMGTTMGPTMDTMMGPTMDTMMGPTVGATNPLATFLNTVGFDLSEYTSMGIGEFKELLRNSALANNIRDIVNDIVVTAGAAAGVVLVTAAASVYQGNDMMNRGVATIDEVVRENVIPPGPIHTVDINRELTWTETASQPYWKYKWNNLDEKLIDVFPGDCRLTENNDFICKQPNGTFLRQTINDIKWNKINWKSFHKKYPNINFPLPMSNVANPELQPWTNITEWINRWNAHVDNNFATDNLARARMAAATATGASRPAANAAVAAARTRLLADTKIWVKYFIIAYLIETPTRGGKLLTRRNTRRTKGITRRTKGITRRTKGITRRTKGNKKYNKMKGGDIPKETNRMEILGNNSEIFKKHYISIINKYIEKTKNKKNTCNIINTSNNNEIIISQIKNTQVLVDKLIYNYINMLKKIFDSLNEMKKTELNLINKTKKV
jgi:hypothetical protein